MSTIQRYSSTLIPITLALVLSSCAASESGTPTTSTPASDRPSASSTNPSGGISIQDPIDTAPLLDQPCTALTDADRTDLNLTEGRVDTDTASSAADACVWERSEDSGSRVDLIAMTENANGLEDIRKQNTNSELFAETQIGKYPALHASTFDQRDRGRCDLWIGVNNSEVFYVFVALRDVPEASDPCGYADKVGEAMIANLSS
ncbi:DUF3558 domain-containing protein [Saccharomonospora iraqiensis]|uniref:DUF3558 domain-containing protein n=1 Tax=Saccharomonospora iraqiensis TaxID=52698 RepID=UPI00022E8991|nr:DUF3558 domain-containing protein [Saccharomonospora iraqiensis]